MVGLKAGPMALQKADRTADLTAGKSADKLAGLRADHLVDGWVVQTAEKSAAWWAHQWAVQLVVPKDIRRVD